MFHKILRCSFLLVAFPFFLKIFECGWNMDFENAMKAYMLLGIIGMIYLILALLGNLLDKD